MIHVERDDPRQWTVDRVLRARAEAVPERVFVHTDDGALTYDEAWRRSAQVANFLESLGAAADDLVAVMLPNGLAFCEAWLGLARLGATLVAINTAYKGELLVHVLNNCRARVLVVDAEWVERVDAVAERLEHLEVLCVPGGASACCPVHDFTRARVAPDTRDAATVDYRSLGCVMYTSGTTGPSKGVMMPHGHLYLFGLGTIEHMGLGEDDVFYIVLPLFHANGLFMQLYATMIAGARAVVRPRFSASNWLGEVIEHGATITNSLGAVAAFVLRQPPSPRDRQHRLRAISLAPSSASLVDGLKRRFGIRDVFGLYGMTEINIPLYTPPGAPKADSCGRLWQRYYEMRIVDPDTDQPMPTGQVGEIVVRPTMPFAFMSGYLRMPEKTVEAWRNFWFHTGDAARMDADGDVFFVDRIKDCIRRRGENISSFEVENVLASHPSVAEVAAYGVAAGIEGAEEEVMVAVVPAGPFAGEERASLLRHAHQGLPHFAVPRYLRLVPSLPRTPTDKVRKHLLKEEGVTADTVELDTPA